MNSHENKIDRVRFRRLFYLGAAIGFFISLGTAYFYGVTISELILLTNITIALNFLILVIVGLVYIFIKGYKLFNLGSAFAESYIWESPVYWAMQVSIVAHLVGYGCLNILKLF